MIVLEALKISLSKKQSKYDVSTISYNRIHIQEIKYLPFIFYGNIIFILPPQLVGVPSAYDHGMDDMGKLF
jgi:hypothetical protein